jgi:hypothetical protein
MAFETHGFSANFGPAMSARTSWWMHVGVFFGLLAGWGIFSGVCAQPAIPLHLYLGAPQVLDPGFPRMSLCRCTWLTTMATELWTSDCFLKMDLR